MLAGLLAAAVCACGTPGPTLTPVSATPPTTQSEALSSPAARSPGRRPLAGLDWAVADFVERPADNVASAPPSEAVHDPNSAGHPGHPPGQAHLQAVTVAGRILVAVGHVVPGFRAAVWTSADGRRWDRVADMPAADDTPLAAVVAKGSTIVAVGRHGTAPAAWTSADGLHWQETRLPVASAAGVSGTDAAGPVQAAAVAGGTVFAAGGWAGQPNAVPSARFWVSSDGRNWTVAKLAPAEASDSRVVGVAAARGRFVAIGQAGPEGSPTGSTAWWSNDGRRWSRVPPVELPPDATLEGVGATPAGFIAVGSSVARDRAVVWLSEDGRHWRSADDQPAYHHFGLKVRMRGVAAGGPGLVVVGVSLFGTQFGTATVWVSVDGTVWQQVPDVPAFDGAEMNAIVAREDGLVAVGTWGAPDQYVPTVWLSPPPG